MIYNRNYIHTLYRKIPEGRSGKFIIIKHDIPKGHVIKTYSLSGHFYDDKFNSNYPVISLRERQDFTEGDTIWMSDTPLEQKSAHYAATVAQGDILILGLGIGLLPEMIRLHNKRIKSITIIEREKDIINLVYQYIRTRKTRIIHDDANRYLSTTDDKFDFIYIDIWDGLVAPIKEGELWEGKSRRCLRSGGIIRWWLEEIHERVRIRLPKKPIASTSLPGIHEPCLICNKTLRADYAGLCLDCADVMGISELFIQGDENT